ncbi:MAG TPA: hypothetical protein VJO16_07835 [Candidatus Acidoferrum sp.]|nr:hypothetical protein [Candidatus Acidoferrum sp.]
MKILANISNSFASYYAALFLVGILATTPFSGCSRGRHTSDSRLGQIDDMLDAQLPAGSSRSKVSFYLSSQGFPVEATNDPHTLVATVHHVDTETLRPATARVTFHFDARDDLTTYELAFAPSSGAQP